MFSGESSRVVGGWSRCPTARLHFSDSPHRSPLTAQSYGLQPTPTDQLASVTKYWISLRSTINSSHGFLRATRSARRRSVHPSRPSKLRILTTLPHRCPTQIPPPQRRRKALQANLQTTLEPRVLHHLHRLTSTDSSARRSRRRCGRSSRIREAKTTRRMAPLSRRCDSRFCRLRGQHCAHPVPLEKQ